MRRMRVRRLVAALLLCAHMYPDLAAATPWNLPTPLGDYNTQLSFEVDSTWHTVHGTTTGVSGRVWIENPADSASLRAEISVPVAQFNTDNSMRDDKLREVMAAEEYPKVKFDLKSADIPCDPAVMVEASRCAILLRGNLSIRSITHAVEIQASVTKQGKDYVVQGSFPITWAEYEVEDPSILIARVDPIATITFALTLKGQPTHE
ncbi:MAG: YceI family protein [Bdellovibrionota bacterium]|nr:MAG: YceI family protein [Bdellovibrionota bacterium]